MIESINTMVPGSKVIPFYLWDDPRDIFPHEIFMFNKKFNNNNNNP